MEAILVERDKAAFSKLQTFAIARQQPGFGVHALNGEFVEKVPDIHHLTKSCANPFRFFFIDPKGWADIPMEKLQPLLKGRSSEVLINLMTRHMNRFLDKDDRAESYNGLFGRPGVLEELRKVPKEFGERSERAVREYCVSLRELCGFKYVSSAVILEPEKELVRYFLVYATNNPHGIEVFKQAEIEAARIQDDVRHESRLKKTKQAELSFGGEPPKSRSALTLRDRYLDRAKKRTVKKLKAICAGGTIKYEEIFCEAMAFPLVTPDDLIGWLDSWKPSVEIRFAKSEKRRKPSASEDDEVVVLHPEKIV